MATQNEKTEAEIAPVESALSRASTADIHFRIEKGPEAGLFPSQPPQKESPTAATPDDADSGKQ